MKCRLCAMINDHSSVRTRYKILDNDAQSEDERIATWYMIPWINIQRHLHSERDLFIGFCLTEILPVVFGISTWKYAVNILTVSNGEKYADPEVNYMSRTAHSQSETLLQRKEFFLLPSCDI